MKRGRQSSAALSVIPIERGRQRLQPPQDLSATEAALFRSIVTQCAPDHFAESDAPLLTSFVQSTILSRKAAKALTSGDASALPVWDRATRMQATLATRLRLAPQSRADPKTVARRLAGHRPSVYDEMEAEG